jgi:hypothetical protein
MAGIQPTVTVEWSPTTDPLATPSWTAVSGWREIQVDRGRQNELDQIQAGTANIVLDNRDRRFDPLHTGGPNYGNVLPMKRFRIRATYASTTYDMFQGFVESWDQAYVNPRDATVEVRLVDFFDVLSAAVFSSSPYEVEMRFDNPDFWWRLGDPPDSSAVTDMITGQQLAEFGNPTLGAASLVANDPDAALDQADATSGFGGTGSFVPVGTVGLSFEAIVKTTTTTDATIASVSNPGEGARIRLYVSAGGTAVFEVGKTVAGNTQSVLAGSSALINDGQPHHIAGVIDGQAFSHLWIYVDGVGTDGGEIGWVVPWAASQEFTVGNVASGFGSPTAHTQGVVGTVDEVALYQQVLSGGVIAAHAEAALAPWEGDTIVTRVTRVLDYLDVADADRSIDTTMIGTLQAAQLGQSLLDHLFEVNEVEQGLLFITKDGKVKFRARHNGFNLASQATFGDGTGELRYGNIAFDYSKQMIYNVIRRQNQDGLLMEASDSTSIATYGRRVDERTGLIGDSDLASLDLANYSLSRSKDPVQRVTEIELVPERDPAGLYPQVLGREIGEQVTIKRRPQAVGSAISFDARIEGIAHTVTPDNWQTTFRLSPADAGAYLQLNLTSGPGLDSLRLAY